MRLARLALCGALLPLLVAGCASQGPANGAKAAPVQVAAAKAAAPAPAAPAATTPAPVVRPEHEQVLPEPTEAEQQAGLQVTHIGVTGAGGLVDARFKVLNAARARALLGSPDAMPMLVVGDLPPLMAPHHGMKTAGLADGRPFFILYPNTRGAVKPGADVIVAVGSIRLGPVKAQ